MEFKVVVDALSSIAAFIAIVATLVAWYQTGRKPLLIDRVVVHRKQQAATFILMVKNIKSHPVTIKRVGCYRRKKHQVQRKLGGTPEYSATFSSADMIFDDRRAFEILPNGHTDARIEVDRVSDIPKVLLFLLETSHGFHELWCKKIDEVAIGTVSVFGIDYLYDYDSAWLARAMFYWKRLLAVIGR